MRFSRLSILVFCFVSLALASVARACEASAVTKQINETIAQVRSGKTTEARRKAAERLESLTQRVRKKVISQMLVDDIASLLNSRDDSVRYSTVVSLGNLGPAAKSAAPKLLKLLPKEDCVNGAITTAGAIRYALVRMGIKPPPPPDCERIAG